MQESNGCFQILTPYSEIGHGHCHRPLRLVWTCPLGWWELQAEQRCTCPAELRPPEAAQGSCSSLHPPGLSTGAERTKRPVNSPERSGGQAQAAQAG